MEPTSNDSMWSDYYVDYLIGMDKAAEWKEQQANLRACVTPEIHQQLVFIAANHGGGPTYWCKHGIARAYFGDGSYVTFIDAWDWSKFNGTR